MTQVNRSNRKRKDSFIDNLTITDKEKKRIGRRWKFLKKKYNIPERNIMGVLKEIKETEVRL